MSACDAGILLVSVIHSATPLATPTMIQVEQSLDDVVIRNAGKIGPGCRGLVSGDLIALVDFLEKGHIARTVSANTLTANFKDSDGDALSSALATMLARGVSLEGNRDGPPFRWRQRFAHKGDMDSDPMS